MFQLVYINQLYGAEIRPFTIMWEVGQYLLCMEIGLYRYEPVKSSSALQQSSHFFKNQRFSTFTWNQILFKSEFWRK